MGKYFVIVLTLMSFTLLSCGGDKSKDSSPATNGDSKSNVSEKQDNTGSDNAGASIGVGPVKEVTLGEIDPAMAKEGQEVFKKNCSSCHKMGKRFVGPSLGGVTERREPEWIMNMIMNPEEMVKKDPTARKLLEEFLAPMANQNISKENARKILEYFRQHDKQS